MLEEFFYMYGFFKLFGSEHEMKTKNDTTSCSVYVHSMCSINTLLLLLTSQLQVVCYVCMLCY